MRRGGVWSDGRGGDAKLRGALKGKAMRGGFRLGTLMLLTAAACGARTGLEVPDAATPSEAEAPALVPLCIEAPLGAPPIEVPLQTQARLERMDVAFLLDTTRSMSEEIARIKRSLSRIIAPAIRQEVRDSQLAFATFADFPVGEYGGPGDRPFVLRQRSSPDVLQVQGAIDSIRLDDGADMAESQVEALYQIATGKGLGDANQRWIAPSGGCPGGGRGYLCLRDESLAVVILISDAPMHNGPDGRYAYATGSIVPPPHRYAEAIAALNAQEIRVMGVSSGGEEGTRDLRRLAEDTGALGRDGQPLVFGIRSNGSGLDRRIVEALQIFTDAVVSDISARAVDPEAGGFDSATLVGRIVPLRAEPASGVSAIDLQNDIFRGVVSGTRVVFGLVIRNGVVMPTDMPQRFRVQIRFLGSAGALLGAVPVDIVVPSIAGEGCP